MNKYHDDQWLDNIARQYEIAFEAYCEMQDSMAKALAEQLGEANVEAVEYALATTNEDLPLRKALRALMGAGFGRFLARMDSLDDAVETCAKDLAERLGWNPEYCCEALCEYVTDKRQKGYAGHFSEWLKEFDAEAEQSALVLNEAARVYSRQRRPDRRHSSLGIQSIETVAARLFVEPDQAARLLEAHYAEKPSESFATWAVNRLESKEAAAE